MERECTSIWYIIQTIYEGNDITNTTRRLFKLDSPLVVDQEINISPPILRELSQTQFRIGQSTTLAKKTQETASQHQIPEDIVLKYTQILDDHKKSQDYLELAVIIRVFKQKIKSNREDILNFIPHITWLLLKSREWNPVQKLMPQKATDYMKEYLEHY